MSPEPGSGKARNIVFLKLRKTGGTTLAASILFPYCMRHGLRYMVPIDWFAAHPRLVEPGPYQMLFRHFPDFPQPWARQWLAQAIGNYRLVTIIRDPVSRVVSRYNHFVAYRGKATFEEYFAANHEQNHQSNWLGYNGRNPGLLEQKFAAIGLTDRFDESMLLMRHALDLELADMLYVHQRRSDKKFVRVADLPAQWVRAIEEIDFLDVQLYKAARELVERRIAAIPGFDAELAEYRAALADFSHALWERRGPFRIGYSEKDCWAEFTGHNGEVRQIGELPP